QLLAGGRDRPAGGRDQGRRLPRAGRGQAGGAARPPRRGEGGRPAGGGARGEGVVWAWRRFLEVLADGHPLVVVIDDLHWAQPALLDLVEQVVALAREAPLLVVAVARPERLEEASGWVRR